MISTFTKLENSEMLQGCAIEMRCSFVDEVNNTKIPADISEYDCWFVLYPYSQEDYAQFIKNSRGVLTVLKSNVNTI